jgi:DNA-binding transcriptional LysR family regulator
VDALPDLMQSHAQEMVGQLRVCAPFGLGRQYIAPALASFARKHPRLHITLDLRESPWPNQHQADVVIHVGAVRDSSWVAHVLARNERWVCASPAYVRLHGQPSRPDELTDHPAICLRENQTDETLWHCGPKMALSRRKAHPSKAQTIRVNSVLVSNDGEVVRGWAQAGLGIALRSQWDVQPLVAQGKLVRLLPDWVFDPADILALVPTRRYHTARVQALLNHLMASFAFLRTAA